MLPIVWVAEADCTGRAARQTAADAYLWATGRAPDAVERFRCHVSWATVLARPALSWLRNATLKRTTHSPAGSKISAKRPTWPARPWPSLPLGAPEAVRVHANHCAVLNTLFDS